MRPCCSWGTAGGRAYLVYLDKKPKKFFGKPGVDNCLWNVGFIYRNIVKATDWVDLGKGGCFPALQQCVVCWGCGSGHQKLCFLWSDIVGT